MYIYIYTVHIYIGRLNPKLRPGGKCGPGSACIGGLPVPNPNPNIQYIYTVYIYIQYINNIYTHSVYIHI